MNQILCTKIINTNKKITHLKAYLIVSILAFIFFFTAFLLYKIQLNKEARLSKYFSDSYSIYKLYSQNSNNIIYDDSSILGTIIIPKINIKYPFFYGCNDDLLKISPCRFSGPMPEVTGNLCIAAHNYEDDRFFGKISQLDYNDEIIIEDNYNNIFIYKVFDKYEVDSMDLSPIENSKNNTCTLTLITCNNINKKRIIIKAKQKA